MLRRCRRTAGRRLADLGASLDVVAVDGLFKLQAGPWATREAAQAIANLEADRDAAPYATDIIRGVDLACQQFVHGGRVAS